MAQDNSALSNFPEGAKNCASEPSQPVEHDGFGFFSSGIFDSWQATDGYSDLKHSNIQPHDFGYEK
jgi:hypothetical protein